MPISMRSLAAIASFSLALMAGTFHSTTALAQDEGDEALELEEVIVTASRREESLQDVALAVTVLDPEVFAKAGMTGLNDILPFVPGVNFQYGGSPILNVIYIRGINSIGAGGVGTYIDDVSYGSATVYAGGGAALDGTLMDLETVNVLKGPQGTLYGASSLSGLIKYKTRDASLDHWSGSISADLSDTKGGGLNQLYRVTANGPLSQDTVGLSFTGFWSDKTGFIDNVTIPKDNWDDYEYYGGSGSLLFKPNDKLTVKAQALYQNSTQQGMATIQGDNEGNPIHGDYLTGELDVQPSTFETSLYGLTIDYDFGFATLTSVTSYQEMQLVQTADLTIPFAFLADLFFPDNAPHTSALFVGDLGWEKFTQEIRLVSEDNEKFEWLVGAYYNKEEGHNIQDLIIVPPEPTFFFANFPSTYIDKSLFATGTWYFTPDFDASFGMRYSETSNSVELITNDSILVQPLPFNKVEENVNNYLFNVRYRPSDNMSVYGRVASGFRPGGANFVIVDPVTQEPLVDPVIGSDSLWSYELGLKGNSPDARWIYELAVFYIDWQDYIIFVTRGGLTVGGNAEKATSKGGEASLNFAVTDSFTIGATLGY